MVLVPGFNIEGVIDASPMDFSLEDKSMEKQTKKKKKKNLDFGKLFPAPKNNENMGMESLYDGEPFEGLL